MWHCEKLKSVSVNISKLQHLETFDFSDCDELIVANLNDGSTAARMAVNAKVFSSLPKVELNFINCSNLDKEALLQQQSFFKRLILSAEEVPSYFTQRTTETSLTNIPLLKTSLSQPFFRFMACAMVDLEFFSTEDDHSPYLIDVFCKFKEGLGKHFGSAQWPMYFSTSLLTLSSHLVIFDCSLPLNGDYAYLGKRHYDHVDIQFRLTDDDSQFKLKGCGIRLYGDGTPSLDIVPHAWKADAINKESETSGQVSRDREEEANQENKGAIKKREHMMLGDNEFGDSGRGLGGNSQCNEQGLSVKRMRKSNIKEESND